MRVTRKKVNVTYAYTRGVGLTRQTMCHDAEIPRPGRVRRAGLSTSPVLSVHDLSERSQRWQLR